MRRRYGAFTLFAFTPSLFQFVLRDRVALGEGYAEETLTEEGQPVLVVRSGLTTSTHAQGTDPRVALGA